MEHERIDCTRTEWAEAYGQRPRGDVIGICFVSPDGRSVVKEFVFTDEPSAWDLAVLKAEHERASALFERVDRLTRLAQLSPAEVEDVTELERLYTL
jgi:hypothetical protein